MKLLDRRTSDGSRFFASWPQTVTWGALCDDILRLPEAEMINFIAEGPAQAWLDFRYRGHRFTISTQNGSFCLVVRDPQCPDMILYQIGCHLERYFEKATQEPLKLHSQEDQEGEVA